MSSDSESDSSAGSYTSEELRIGRDFWVASSMATYPNNGDGSWDYSPVVHDQIELLRSGKVESERMEEEIEALLGFMRVEEEFDTPENGFLDVAEAIEDGRIGRWESEMDWVDSKTQTATVRVLKWLGCSLDHCVLEIPAIEAEDKEECTCGADGQSVTSDWSFDGCLACLGALDALVRDDASPEAIERAEDSLAKMLRLEMLRFTTEEACRQELEREPMEEGDEWDDEGGLGGKEADFGHFDEELGVWVYPEDPEEWEGEYGEAEDEDLYE